MGIYEELEWRGVVKDISSPDLKDKLNNEKLTFYLGTDPTADSLHLGHYSSFMTAKRLMLMGHHPIILCGGATGRIGDPRPTSERQIMPIEELNKNVECLRKQIDKIFDGKAQLVNNYDWFKGYEFLDFLRDVGKYVNVNYMLNKDIIQRRLDTGITYAEFSYMLIQGYDFLNMYEKMNCTMQAAGSDQWGNITTGIDLIRKILGKEAYGFTMPLILDSTGKKFGKSEGNALWLDEEKTSSYELYQYLINTDDSKVYEYLKVFTFLSPEEIDNIMDEHSKTPEKRIAQKKLAECIITDLHGVESYKNAVNISESLFNGDIKSFTKKDIEVAFKGLDVFNVESDLNIVDLLVNSGACSSKREAREFISNGSITLNGEKVTDLDFVLTKEKCIENTYIVIRRGKKKYFIGIYE